METILQGMVWDLVKTVAVVGLFFLPVTILLVTLRRQRRKSRAESVEPFTDRPLRPPGESLRQNIDQLSDQVTDKLLFVLLAGLCIGLPFAVQPSVRKPIPMTIGFVIVAAVTWWRGRELYRVARLLANYRLGYEGERLVGETLNQLLRDGWHVFHDVPFEGFNIDHVIVGVGGLYSVETKTRRKPKSAEKGKQYQVTYDGKLLHYPWAAETAGLEQAERNAKTLALWLTEATGERTFAKSFLLLPGWWVTTTAVGPVTVLNPKQIWAALPQPSAQRFNDDRVKRIAHQLSERCRLKPESE